MQFIVNGVISGLLIALLATAWQLVYLPTRILFVALGAIYAFAPFAAFALVTMGWPLLAAAVVAVGACALLSVLCEVVNHGPLAARRASETAQFVSSLGLYLILVQAVALTWGTAVRTLRTGNEAAYQLGQVTLLQSQVLSGATAAALLVGILVVIKSTPTGLRFRALADNPDGLALLGYDIRLIRQGCFAGAGAAAGAVSLLNAYATGFDPFLGLNAALVALAAVLIGGRNGFVGPILAGVALGSARAVTVWLLSPQWQDPITYGLLTLVLIIRPDGLFAPSRRLEAAAA